MSFTPAHILNQLELANQLLYCLEEAHEDEMLHNHHGDKGPCSYCKLIEAAEDAGLEPEEP